MTPSPRSENIATLQQLVGLDAAQADELVDAEVQVTVDDEDSRPLAVLICRLLRRTLRDAGESLVDGAAVEIIVGNAKPRSTARKVWVSSSGSTLSIGTAPVPSRPFRHPPIFNLIVACHAAATAVRLLSPAGRLTFADPIIVDPSAVLGGRVGGLGQRVRFDTTFLAGAGAIGNAFVFGLSLLDVEGELHVVDPDVVSIGNLNRTLLFELDDVGQPKVEALVRRAAALLPGVRFIPRACRIQDLAERGGRAWLERLVVGVDSRRARRRLQEELPLHVFDASTTGIAETVLTFHTAASGHACMSCLYPLDLVEHAHETHVASTLGVSVGDVQEHHVSASAASAIAIRHPHLGAGDLIGIAYDTLFKRLCSAGELRAGTKEQVLAPLAFVSALAGAYLALEFVLRVGRDDVTVPFNHWRISPWSSPVFDLRSLRPRSSSCECCGRQEIRAIVDDLWGRNRDGTHET